MASKYRAPSRKKRKDIDLESNRWFVPAVFGGFFLAVVWLFSDFIFSAQMLYGSDTLQAGYVFRSFLVDYWHQHGSVPQWIPYSFGGMPYVEAFHGDIFYPLSSLKLFMPLKRALGWSLILHIYLAGLFMYLAARQFKLSKIPALFAAASYMFAAYFVSMVAPGHDGKIFVIALFPLLMLFLDRGFEKTPLLNFSLLGLVIGLILLTPHPQMSYFALWALSFYAAYKLILIWLDKKALMPVIKPGLMVTYAVLLGLMLSAIQMYPGISYTQEFSPRADTKKGWQWATSWSMHEEEVASLIIPEFAGTSTSQAETYYWGKNAFKDNSESVGTVPLFVAMLGLICYRRRKLAWFFGGLGLFAILYGMGETTPFFWIPFTLVPKVESMRAPAMIMFLASFSVAMLAGMGVQSVVDGYTERKKAGKFKIEYFLLGYPALMFLLAVGFSLAGRGLLSLWCSLFYSEAPSLMVQQGFSKFDVAVLNLPAIQSGAWLAFLFTALAAAAIWFYRQGKAGSGILVLLLAIPVIDGVRFDARFVGVVDEMNFRSKFAPNGLTDYLSGIDEKFRVLNLGAPKDASLPLHGIDVVVGYHGNQLRWYDDLLGGPALLNINRPNARFLNLAGTRYLINSTAQEMPLNYFGPRSIVMVASFGQAKLLRNDNAFPRLFLADEYSVEPDRKQIVREVISGSTDLRQVVLLEESPTLEMKADTIDTDSVWFEMYEPDSIRVAMKLSRNQLLVLTDSWFDAWEVTVDGAPAKLLRAYGAFRAVEVSAGAKEVAFRYHSERYLTARLVTWLTALYLVCIIGGSLVLNRRREKDEETDETEQAEEAGDE